MRRSSTSSSWRIVSPPSPWTSRVPAGAFTPAGAPFSGGLKGGIRKKVPYNQRVGPHYGSLWQSGSSECLRRLATPPKLLSGVRDRLADDGSARVMPQAESRVAAHG